MNYYFLIASLPLLKLEETPPLTVEKFRRQCEDHLTAVDLKALDNLLSGKPSSPLHRFVEEWIERETRLRNALVRLRALRSGDDPEAFVRATSGYDSYTEKAAAEAMARPHPAERELELDRFRWNVIEELAGLDPFAVDVVLAYGLKLNLVWRWVRLSEAKGHEVVKKIVNA